MSLSRFDIRVAWMDSCAVIEVTKPIATAAGSTVSVDGGSHSHSACDKQAFRPLVVIEASSGCLGSGSVSPSVGTTAAW